MNISWAPPMLSDAEFAHHVSALLEKPVADLARITHGMNSLVFRVRCADDTLFAAKQYLHPTADGRSRLEVEFGALELLQGHEVGQVPRPIACDRGHDLGVYEYIDGQVPEPAELCEADLDTAIHFLLRLDSLAQVLPEEAAFPAAEACFCAQNLLRDISYRLAGLLVIPEASSVVRTMHTFLRSRLIPELRQVRIWAESQWAALGSTPDARLRREEWTLSPSDFGFHNALRKRDGTLVFVDFEYFGWDNPAKLMADFLLHPAMSLSDAAKERFVRKMCGGLKRPLLEKRLPVAYALFGVKWSLILLNGFVPGSVAQARLASGSQEQAQALSLQLQKAEVMLDRAVAACKEFPYCGGQ